MRKYKPKPIPKKKLKYVLEAGRHVPSWTNRQRWWLFVSSYNDTASAHASAMRFLGEGGVARAMIVDDNDEPARMFVWCPDPRDPCSWHNESAATFSNLSMFVSMSGMIHTRLVDGKPEPFPAIHYCVGGAWDLPTVGGHLAEGTRVKGVVEVFVTEILGIEELLPSNYDLATDGAPEEWYRETK